ncbi:unnamed protein product, partial [Ectocarpus sp. 12 AP-2014]
PYDPRCYTYRVNATTSYLASDTVGRRTLHVCLATGPASEATNRSKDKRTQDAPFETQTLDTCMSTPLSTYSQATRNKRESRQWRESKQQAWSVLQMVQLR